MSTCHSRHSATPSTSGPIWHNLLRARVPTLGAYSRRPYLFDRQPQAHRFENG